VAEVEVEGVEMRLLGAFERERKGKDGVDWLMIILLCWLVEEKPTEKER